MTLHLSEELAFTTVRLEGVGAEGWVSTGTGFLYRVDVDVDRWAPAIVTNKHVVHDVDTLTLHLSLSNESGEPVLGHYHTVRIPNLQTIIINHPSADVDMCAIPCGGLLTQLAQNGVQVFAKYFKRDHIPLPSDEADFGALEPVLMVGYPNGLWDSVNNRPLMRRGVTSTHPGIDLNGKGEFLIDAACFPGSSGSPVILWREPGSIDRLGNINMTGINPKLLGVLFAGPIATVEGAIVVKPIPTGVTQVPQLGIPMNLGCVVKSRFLIDLEPAILAFATKSN